MKLFDVNVLVYVHRPDLKRHTRTRQWWEAELNSPSAFGMAELTLSGFLRIVTNPKIFVDPTPLDVAVREIERIRNRPNCVPIRPGPRHYDIFIDLCRKGHAKGELVADAYFAALAIEHGCEWLSFDRDFARFPGLNWATPPED